MAEAEKSGFLRFVIVGLGAALVVGGVGWAVRSASQPAEVEILPAVEESTAEESEIWVDVGGAVMRPGVYKLKAGSRVHEALAAAGGLAAEADRVYVTRFLNLAQKLVDGAKLYIPAQGEAPPVEDTTGEVAGRRSEKINLNTASLKELESLWGVGPARAQAIVDQRPYSSVEELLEKKVVPKNVYERIKDEVGVW